MLRCSDLTDSTVSTSTTIQISQSKFASSYLRKSSISNFSPAYILDSQYTPTLRISDEPQYGADDVIVTVEWDQLEGVTYMTRISPLTSIISTSTTGRQLTILYNTNYNFSVEAAPPCRPNPTAFIVLHYGEEY